jgi:hypothetical protein
MIQRWKAEFRMWLVDLVRDAVRIELLAFTYVKLTPHLDVKPKPPVVPAVTEPSFEQMQAQAIEAQTKFYEPKE